ncbi:conserved hypothetical protein [Arthrobacter sp. Hiyo8]|nr:conserved hypothetical protein [Arthrobacter sp. Hiyo8]
MPPRELLQLKLPKDAVASGQHGAPHETPELQRPERGPEITQIG